jgi:flagellar biosynthesis chaperone FliJ
MQRFHFRLDRVLAWRGTQLEMEQYQMKRLSAVLEQMECDRALLLVERTRAERAVLGGGSIDGADLAAHAAFLVRLGNQERELDRRRQQQEQRLAEQHQHLMEARRRVRLLERLKTRRLAEWELELGRELEQFAAEAHLARWNAERR